ncbi:MAG: ABC transporter ATP-binding protein [Parvibaculaceae bacterium]
MSGALSIRDLTAGYGGLPVIENVGIDVEPQSVAVIIGPNGAGKSTVLKTLFGLTERLSGSIAFEGRDIQGTPTEKLVALGISAVPQSRNVFASLSVMENLEVGTYAAPPKSLSRAHDRVLDLFPDLKARLKRPAGELSGGQRQMVAIGRALMSEPRLLVLDEPTAGLSPAYLTRILDLVVGIRSAGTTVLMVEQNARQALGVADRGYVLVGGRNFASGTGPELLADAEVRRSFLGGAAA